MLIGLDDLPIGCKVMTPTGKIGQVVKHRECSRIDPFPRVEVRFGKNVRDGVLLQPHLLKKL